MMEDQDWKNWRNTVSENIRRVTQIEPPEEYTPRGIVRWCIDNGIDYDVVTMPPDRDWDNVPPERCEYLWSSEKHEMLFGRKLVKCWSWLGETANLHIREHFVDKKYFPEIVENRFAQFSLNLRGRLMADKSVLDRFGEIIKFIREATGEEEPSFFVVTNPEVLNRLPEIEKKVNEIKKDISWPLELR